MSVFASCLALNYVLIFSGDFAHLLMCVFMPSCIRVSVCHPQQAEGDLRCFTAQIRAIHSVPEGSHAETGADLNDVE